jgi:5-methylcytosine-specific restriction endonuclease McrA
MKQILPKEAPIRLEQQDYQKLREQVLRRDGWRCQLCGSMTNLEVHHKQFRSHSGEDDEQNLITLCFNCHSSAHGQDLGPKSDQGCGEGATQVSELDLQLPWCRSF